MNMDSCVLITLPQQRFSQNIGQIAYDILYLPRINSLCASHTISDAASVTANTCINAIMKFICLAGQCDHSRANSLGHGCWIFHYVRKIDHRFACSWRHTRYRLIYKPDGVRWFCVILFLYMIYCNVKVFRKLDGRKKFNVIALHWRMHVHFSLLLWLHDVFIIITCSSFMIDSLTLYKIYQKWYIYPLRKFGVIKKDTYTCTCRYFPLNIYWVDVTESFSYTVWLSQL